MTQTEAALLADRLARVWGGFVVEIREGKWAGDLENGLKLDAWLLCEQMSFKLKDGRSGLVCHSLMPVIRDSIVLRFHYGTECHELKREDSRLQSAFTAQWLLFFRRGLYLMGCDIEATLHEKMQWLDETKEAGTLREDEVRELLERERAGVAS